MAKNKQKSQRHKTPVVATPIRTVSYREQKYQAWRKSNPERKLLYSAYQDTNFFWSWYDDNTVICSKLSIDEDGDEKINYTEVASEKITWNEDDFFPKVYPKEGTF